MGNDANDGARKVDEYLAATVEPQRSTLTALRATLRELLPDAVEGISYGMPVFKVDGTAIAGYAAFTRHCAYLPHSGNVLAMVGDALAGYTSTSGSLHFAVDRPLPKALVRKLVKARQLDIAARRRK